MNATSEKTAVETTDHVDETFKYVPDIDPRYYVYGNFEKILSIIESGKFYPIWITGLSGNGKTQMIEQACARAGLPKQYYDNSLSNKEKTQILTDHIGKGRELIRVNFTMETDENDLLGGFRLVNGDTEFHEGPVIEALRRGAVLLLDEVDVGHTNRIMCLQSVLEGKGVLLKATGEFVKPKAGFQVFATSNTRGRGSEDGKFIGTNIMNGAFLDRFAGMFFQDYPPAEIEDFILKRYFISYHWSEKNKDDDIDADELKKAAVFIAKLCKWAAHIRESHKVGSVEEVITTRALINIIQGYSIFNDAEMAIELACERFDPAVKQGFLDIYQKYNGKSDNKKTKSDEGGLRDTGDHLTI